MLKDTTLCMGCMNEKTYDGPCKLCGYEDNSPCIPAYLPPRTFLNERYIVGKLLNYNGEGATYIGFDNAAGIKVTIKEFMPDTLCSRKKGEGEIIVNTGMMPLYKTYMSEFADLGKSLMKSRGMAHIQTVLDVFYENNTCYTVYEFINGISLKTYLANSAGEMSWEQVKELFPPILTTISLIHSAGIIHRGISPQTIFVTDKMELKLTGFSISAARTTNTEIACEIFTGYAAPEQYTNEINGTWTDVYGIAAVLYRVLTGTNPQEAIARTGGSMLEPMMINRNVPANISKVIMNGMRLSTESRIRSITEFVDKLFAQPKYVGAEGKPSPERPLTRQQKKKLAKQKKERVKTLVVLGIAGAVLIAFAVVFAMTLGGAFAPSRNESSEDSENVSSAAGESTETNAAADSVSADSPAPVSEEAPETSDSPDAPDASVPVVGANISLPDFTNRSYESTVSRYEGTFTFIPDYKYSEEYSAGMMYDQSIAAGTMVSEGVIIEVKVSKGRSFVPLPDYTDTVLSDYISKLTGLNIKYSVESKRTNDVPDGYVAECSKDIGDLVNVEEGETIIVYSARNYRESTPETSEQRDTQPAEAIPLPNGRIPVE